MLKKHMAACLVASVFAAAPAFAQTSTTPSGSTDRPAATGSGSATTGSPAMQPQMTNPPAGSSSMTQSGAMQGHFMTQMDMSQMRASKLIGTKVISANNESIGDINDVIIDRNGQAVAAVVGVGGFLGIGEKDVAIPFNSLEFATREQVSAMRGDTSVSTTGSTATTGTTAPAQQPRTTGTTTTTTSSRDTEPERVILRMTKAELQAAPSFAADRDNTTTGTSTTAPATTAPKP